MRVIKAFSTFVWFLNQCVTVGGLGVQWFASGFVIVCVLLSTLYLRAPVEVRKRFLGLLVLPLIWTFIGLWGAYFWLDWQKSGAHNPGWTQWPPMYGLWAFAIAALVVIVYARGGRLFAAVFSLANLYFMLGITLLSHMAVTGEWL